jgi:hypothetical protein
MDENHPNFSYSYARSDSHTFAYGSGNSGGIHTGDGIYTTTCTRACLAREVQTFQRRLIELAATASARDFVWYRRAILDAFDRVLDADTDDITSEKE